MLILVRSLSGLVLPWKSKELLDRIIPAGNMDELYTVIALVCGAIFLQAISSFSLTRLLSVRSSAFNLFNESTGTRKLLKLPISFFDNNKSGALVSRVMSDVEGVRNLVGTGLEELVGGTITAVVSLFIFN